MLEPNGTVYFYSPVPVSFPCQHSCLYVVLNWNDASPAFCGLCFLANLIRDEAPSRIHEYKTLAENGNPEYKAKFIRALETALGMKSPEPGANLNSFRLARKQYRGRPSKRITPGTYGLWSLFGYQPRMAQALLRLIVGYNELQVAAEMNLSIYAVQTLAARGIRTALRFAR